MLTLNEKINHNKCLDSWWFRILSSDLSLRQFIRNTSIEIIPGYSLATPPLLEPPLCMQVDLYKRWPLKFELHLLLGKSTSSAYSTSLGHTAHPPAWDSQLANLSFYQFWVLPIPLSPLPNTTRLLWTIWSYIRIPNVKLVHHCPTAHS